MIVQCAWCNKKLGEKEPLSDTSITHGICEGCLEKYFPDTAKKLKLSQAINKDEIQKEEELPSNHEMLFHFGIEEAGSPGAVLDESTARSSACSCFTYKGKDMCWSKGVVGLLTQDQQKTYCIAGKSYKERPALVSRYTKFAEAAEEAHKKIEDMPKGMPRLEAWLEAMGEELSLRGIEI